MESAELPWRKALLSEGIEDFQRLAVEHHDLCLAPVADVQEPLLGVWPESRASGRGTVTAFRRLAFPADEYSRHVFATQRKHLDSLAASVARGEQVTASRPRTRPHEHRGGD